MPAIGFPQHQVASLQELALRLLDSRKAGGDGEALTRDLLVGFFDACMRSGLDRVLADLAQAFPPLDIADRFALFEHPILRALLVENLGKIDLDDGGPRNAKPRQLVDCLIASLSLAISEEPVQAIALSDDVRVEVMGALASVIDVELAVPQIRETVIAKGRERCEERYLGSFDRIAAQLDERGMRMIRQPKVPLDAVQAVQQVLVEARQEIIATAAHAAIDRAIPVLARADAEAAARIDRPITHRLTPRDVALRRANEARVPKVPAAVVHSVFESLTELAHLEWQPLERPVRTYAASQTFAVGDLLDHPKFGRGSVISSIAQRIEVEFADGKHTLIHVRATK